MNHSTAAGALNTAGYTAFQGLPMPLLFVCEDNGLGISVKSPAGWTAEAASGRPKIRYFAADGCDLADAYDAAQAAASYVRERRAPAVLHLRTVRLGGHAGTDVESAYRSPAEIAADADRDPLLGTARLLVESGAMAAADVLDRYEAIEARVLTLAGDLADAPRLSAATDIMAPLAPRRPGTVTANVAAGPAGRRLAAASDLRRAVARGRGAADARAGHQPHARRRARRAARACSCSARTSAARAASTASPAACSSASAPAGCSTRCSTSSRSSGCRARRRA